MGFDMQLHGDAWACSTTPSCGLQARFQRGRGGSWDVWTRCMRGGARFGRCAGRQAHGRQLLRQLACNSVAHTPGTTRPPRAQRSMGGSPAPHAGGRVHGPLLLRV